ncbi:MAG: histidine--tRNA ligase, partial [Rhodospirillales bacterium]
GDGDSMTLRPENTAGVARAYISNGLQQEVPLKYFYAGPMFRHERPQKGRQRQFHQFGIELLGVPEPEGDVEIIVCGAAILDQLGVGDSCRLQLNTLGDTESRQAYRAALVDYFSAHVGDLSDDSRMRLERNPMRILDSKDAGDRTIVAGAPEFGDHLNDASKAFFATVKDGLTRRGIAFELNSRLVRGLDYYCHTAFEFVTDALGAQGTVLAGGRYDGLVGTMGGPETPGVGWAAGIERLAMLVGDAAPVPAGPVAVIPVGDDVTAAADDIVAALRGAGIATDIAFRGNLKRRMKRADKINARAAILLGEDELARQVATVRDLKTGEQQEVAIARLADYLTTGQ